MKDNNNFKIFYDNYIFLRQNRGGIKRYFENLIYSNIKNHPYLRKYLLDRNKYNFIYKYQLQYLSYLKPYLFNLINDKNLIYHGTYYLNPFLSLYKFKKVITIHDMIPEIKSERFKDLNKKKLNLIRYARRFSIYNSDHIITPTNTTKKDLIQYYPDLEHNKISVINHGIDHFSKGNCNMKVIKEFKNVDFFLYVGSRSYYKGFFDLLRALSKVVEKKPDILLICAGSKFTLSELRLISELNLNSRNLISLKASNSQLKFLYKFAKSFIYPSHYEGFGFPPLEAIISGSNNIICSSIPSTHEICSEEVTYYPVGCIDSLTELLLRSLENNSNIKPKKDYEFLDKYSWHNSAKKHNQLYFNLLNTL